jgi:hypothetical protein
MATEPVEQVVVAAPSSTALVSAAHSTRGVAVGNAVASANAGTLAGVVFQVASAGLDMSAGPRLADQFFQALALSASNPNDPILTVPDTFERGLAGRPQRTPVAESIDSLNWDELGTALDWQNSADALLVPHRSQRDVRVNQTSAQPPVSQPTTERIALDRYFALAAAETTARGPIPERTDAGRPCDACPDD